MITILNAQIYSIANGTEVAYAVTYSDGTEVRAVVSGGWIRNEYKTANGEWKLAGKPYIVQHNKKRQGERLIETVRNWVL